MTHHLTPTLRRSAIASAALLALCQHAAAVEYVWSNGNFAPGSTAPSPLLSPDVLQINAGSTKMFSAVNFSNQGTVNWNADALYLQSGAQVDNAGLWNAFSDDVLQYNGGSTTTFNNTGTFRKAGGSGSTTIGNINFANSGVLDAQTGSIVYAGNSISFNAGTQFIGAGSNRVTGSVAFNGAFTSNNLVLASGGFNGNGAVLGGAVDFVGGTFGGSWEVASGQTLYGRDGSTKMLSGAALTNKGTLAWETGNALYLQSGASISNQGLIDFRTTSLIQYNGGSQTLLDNSASGTVKAAAGVTGTIGGVHFVNSGGTLQANGTLDFAGGDATFLAGTRFTGSGLNLVTNNARFVDDFTSGNLRLQSGTFSGGDGSVGSQALLKGTVEFTGGNFGGTWEVANGHSLLGKDGSTKMLSGAALSNNGTIAWQTGEALYLQSGARVDNRNLFEFQTTSAIAYNGGSTTVFNNTGTLRAIAGVTGNIGGVSFVNNGGTLEANGTLNFGGGDATFNNGTLFSGSGVNVVSNNARFVDGFESQNLRLQSGTFTGGDGSVGSKAVLGGTVAFVGGTLAGEWNIASGQTLAGRAGSTKLMAGAHLVNNGSMAWQTGEALYLQSGALLENKNLFEFQTSSSVDYNGGSTTVFDNTGTLRVVSGETGRIGAVKFVNNGGTLQANGTLNFNGGDATFNSGTRFIGSGSNVVTNNARFAGSFESQNLTLQSGTFTGDTALANGSTRWTGGTLAGSWTVANGASMNAGAGSAKLINGASVVNRGTLNVEASENIYLQSGAVLTNQGRLDLQGDGSVYYNGGAAVAFVNDGLLVKTGGAGTSNVAGVGFVNNGTTDVRVGVIQLPNNFSNAGMLTGAGAFTTSQLINNGHVAPGNGAGVLTLNGAYQQTAAGALDIELATSLLFDRFVINGNAQLDGTLALSCIAGCALNDGDSFVILDATGQMTGTFAGITTSGFGNGFDYSVTYDDLNDLVRLEVIHAGLPVPEPGTWAMLAAGLGVLGALSRRRGVGLARG